MTASSRPISLYGDPGGPDCRCGAEHRPRQLVGMTDGGGNGERNVRTAVDLINDFVRDGAKVFLHCHAGQSRSVVILAIHLGYRAHWRKFKANGKSR